MTEHPRGRVVGWVLMALGGLAIAVALSVAASNLSTQPIGISGEPLKAGDRLAPVTVTRTQVVTGAQPDAGKRRSTTDQTERTTGRERTTGHERPGDDRGHNTDGDDD